MSRTDEIGASGPATAKDPAAAGVSSPPPADAASVSPALRDETKLGAGLDGEGPPPFRIHGDGVDVVEIMRQIRERIKEKKEKGIYTDEEIEELSELKIQTFAEASEIDSELLRRLLEPNHGWNISSGYRISTHRPGLKGKIIVFLKKLVRPFVRLYTDHIVDRQAQLNLYMVYLVHNLTRELTRLQIEHRKVDYRCQVLQRDLDWFKDRLRALEDMAVLRDGAVPTGNGGVPAPRSD